MSERDREQRVQGSSPYDEPTETFRMPQSPPGPDEDSTGVHGYQPYRRDADAAAESAAGDGSTRRAGRGAISDGDPSPLTTSAGERADRPYWDDDASTTAIPDPTVSRGGATPDDAVAAENATATKTTAIPVDRDSFHREHNRRAAYADDDVVPAYRAGSRGGDGSDPDLSDPDLSDGDLHDAAVSDDSRTRAIARSEPDDLDDDGEPAGRSGRFSRRRRDPERGDRSTLDDELAVAQAAQRRGTTDLGLLALRVAVGLIAMAHGAQKLFGWWNGPRLSGFEDFLLNSPNTAIGFSGDAAKPLAIVGALSETLGGLMLVLGLLTPIAGSAVLGVMIIAATYKATLAGGVWFFASGSAGPGIEYELMLGVAAAAIILAGPGRLSLDFGRGWATRPFVGSVAWLVVGIAAPVAIWILFNGTNPFVSPGNPPVQ